MFSRVKAKYLVVSGNRYLLAWDFDPDMFVNIRRDLVGKLKEINAPYDYMMARQRNAPYKMSGEGYNLRPGNKGNDWSHISLGMLKDISEDELKQICSVSQLEEYKPSEVVIDGITPTFAGDGFYYATIHLDYPQEMEAFSAYLRQNFKGRFGGWKEIGRESPRVHSNLLTFRDEDRAKVRPILKDLESKYRGRPAKVGMLRFWSGHQVEESCEPSFKPRRR